MHKKSKNKILHGVKSNFVVGLVVILPLFITIYIIWFLFRNIDRILGQYFEPFIGNYVYGLGFAVLLIIILVVGVLSNSSPGKFVIRHLHFLLFRTPLFGDVFRGIDSISTKVLSESKDSFRQVVMIETPKKGIYSFGFMTSRNALKFRDGKNLDLFPVFVPTTPNPTSGWFYFIEKKDITLLDMTVEKAMETIISLGFSHPEEIKKRGKN